MVVFTCNHCGDPLKKPKVAVHYQQKCRNAPPFVTCVDCLKDFRGDEYVAHTKCITEAERYNAKDYVPKPSANKGERKQQEWITIVGDLLNGTADLSNAERNFLNILSKYENVPRKKVKFLNFVRNAMGNRVHATVVNSVWDKMESMHRQSQQAAAKTPEKNSAQSLEQSKSDEVAQNTDVNNSIDNQNVAENQNNENLCKENHSPSRQNGSDEVCKMTNGHLHERRDKSKKRRLDPAGVQLAEEGQTAAKIRKQPGSETGDSGNDVAKFQWKQTILDILRARGEMSLRKLQNKVMNKCIYYVFSLNDNTFKLTEYTKAVEKFNKAVNKLKGCVIHVSGNKVRLDK
ncbi:PREDICTED: cell growth-regulating nucleolar protein [Vollenhovia emeryi]|uniref:cell growth-regulating nucleolar protein n=1 Tax=Vollenhovia emeryi TaxID=411798 RepID=UPI0005F4F39F|nr:PREDICTED: cell growth-regulating nucleolar protein [Vollenhovia emeryi]